METIVIAPNSITVATQGKDLFNSLLDTVPHKIIGKLANIYRMVFINLLSSMAIDPFQGQKPPFHKIRFFRKSILRTILIPLPDQNKGQESEQSSSVRNTLPKVNNNN